LRVTTYINEFYEDDDDKMCATTCQMMLSFPLMSLGRYNSVV